MPAKTKYKYTKYLWMNCPEGCMKRVKIISNSEVKLSIAYSFFENRYFPVFKQVCYFAIALPRLLSICSLIILV